MATTKTAKKSSTKRKSAVKKFTLNSGVSQIFNIVIIVAALFGAGWLVKGYVIPMLTPKNADGTAGTTPAWVGYVIPLGLLGLGVYGYVEAKNQYVKYGWLGLSSYGGLRTINTFTKDTLNVNLLAGLGDNEPMNLPPYNELLNNGGGGSGQGMNGNFIDKGYMPHGTAS